ncbi:LLM class flavin-dependent oxidoreductase [Prescottella agglutinans]|uniref:Alkanesulfonate monooxygenase SsuD/methylene tetrahydromethanopterin reductase-like flavin-dependent oxidoreductase (Luciferase family) n=1 Tax=Prescottella agglutinans TaxID=1644129 RepID=A0ABT6MLI7_9NOCA|nr:LLM class flavin-dependent oxidoreductase [Prescottella agglutinans]MDH6284706.1 alkanesulfonate monooxygenase SsuD/methylene tetrahydromethanopterin reductase-like flavin-dependent oxidoreductase (luciferase family) [Prescottella agglutinans]
MPLKVGLSVTDALLVPEPEVRRRLLDTAAAAGLDHITVGDHISFHGGTGFDGMVSATSILSTHDTLSVVIGVYLLGLRHPMLAARQIATLSQIAPGRLVLGAGVGGEDRSEVANSGVDPSTRGRRLDETLEVLRALLIGEEVNHAGEFFTLDRARILPPPQPAVPILIGGRGDSAIRRTARYGDGWLGIFCTPRRFAETRTAILDAAAQKDRTVNSFGVNVWCGLDTDSSVADRLVGEQMGALYQLPRDKFRHLAPAGTPEQVAEWLSSFVEAGADNITLVPVAASMESAIEHAASVRALLLAATR